MYWFVDENNHIRQTEAGCEAMMRLYYGITGDTQFAGAQKLGVSNMTMYNIKRGRHLPRRATLVRMMNRVLHDWQYGDALPYTTMRGTPCLLYTSPSPRD